jgi:hypothetical protein
MPLEIIIDSSCTTPFQMVAVICTTQTQNLTSCHRDTSVLGLWSTLRSPKDALATYKLRSVKVPTPTKVGRSTDTNLNPCDLPPWLVRYALMLPRASASSNKLP